MSPNRATGATAVIFGVFLVTVMATSPRGQAPAVPGRPPWRRLSLRGRPVQARPARRRLVAGKAAAGAEAEGIRPQRYSPISARVATATTWRVGARRASSIRSGWRRLTDAAMIKSIKEGVPTPRWSRSARRSTTDQIWSLVQYIRTQTFTLQAAPGVRRDPNGVVLTTEKQKVRVEVLTADLNTPFGLAFLPDGRLLITERPGRLRVFANGKLSEPVKGTPTVHAVQDGGLLDVEVHPQYAPERLDLPGLLAKCSPGSYTPRRCPRAPVAARPPAAARRAGWSGPGGCRARQGRGRGPQIPGMTVIVRGKLSRNNEWTDHSSSSARRRNSTRPSGSHYGLRFTFDRERHLFYSIGERGAAANAQDLKAARQDPSRE